MGSIITASKLGIPIQPALGRREGLLTDERWHRHGYPLVGGSRALARAWAHGLQGRFAVAGWRRVRAATIGGAGIGRIAQDAPHPGGISAGAAAGGGGLRVGGTFWGPNQNHLEVIICVP